MRRWLMAARMEPLPARHFAHHLASSRAPPSPPKAIPQGLRCVLSVVKMYFIPTEFFIRREKKHQFGSPERVFNAVRFSAGRGVHETVTCRQRAGRLDYYQFCDQLDLVSELVSKV